MKMTPEHFEHIRTAVRRILDDEYGKIVVNEYETGKFNRSDRVEDLNKRFRWDLFHAAGLNRFACDVLYEYLDDTHIDTALRNIVPTIERRY